MQTIQGDPKEAFKRFLKRLGSDPRVAEATALLLQRVDRDTLPHCPCCGRVVKVYKRKLYWKMAAFLVELTVAFKLKQTTPNGWIDISKWPKAFKSSLLDGGDYGKAQLWGLADKYNDPDHGGRSSLWRPTPIGREFAVGRFEAPAYVWTYNGFVFGRSEETVSVQDALGEHFDYAEAIGRIA